MLLFLFSGFSFPQDYCLKTDKWCHLFKSYLCFGALFPGFFRQTQIRIFTSTVLICVFLLFSSKFFVQTQINDIADSIPICVLRIFLRNFSPNTDDNFALRTYSHLLSEAPPLYASGYSSSFQVS